MLLYFREGEATASKHSNGVKGVYNQHYSIKEKGEEGALGMEYDKAQTLVKEEM